MGVRKKFRRWQVDLSVNRKIIYVGTFATEAEARAAYAHAVATHGADRVTKPRRMRDPRERFLSKVDQSGECHLWRGALGQDGYGKFQLNGGGKQQHVRAHRYAFFLAHGRWPSEFVLHSCDTPACVNPEHLSEGSQTENLIQCVVRGRRSALRLNVDLVRCARERHAAGETTSAIARDLGVKRETLDGAIQRRSWRHVA
jgi:hypothetical protein